MRLVCFVAAQAQKNHGTPFRLDDRLLGSICLWQGCGTNCVLRTDSRSLPTRVWWIAAWPGVGLGCCIALRFACAAGLLVGGPLTACWRGTSYGAPIVTRRWSWFMDWGVWGSFKIVNSNQLAYFLPRALPTHQLLAHQRGLCVASLLCCALCYNQLYISSSDT